MNGRDGYSPDQCTRDEMDCGQGGNSEISSGDGTTFAGMPAIASGGIEKTESRRCSAHEGFIGICSASGLGSMLNMVQWCILDVETSMVELRH